jgi:pentatricopeptide repeat protein
MLLLEDHSGLYLQKITIHKISHFSAERNTTSARLVFDELPSSARTVYVWNSIMNAYIVSCQNQNVLNLFELMNETSCVPNEDTYLLFIKASKKWGLLCTILKVEDIEKHVLHVTNDKPSDLCKNVMVDLFEKAGDCKYFCSIKEKNMYSWNSMLNAFGHNSMFEDCMNIFQRMLSENVAPDSFTFAALLFACSKDSSFSIGCKLILESCLMLDITPIW